MILRIMRIFTTTKTIWGISVCYKNSGVGAEIVEEHHYYPFGLKHGGYHLILGDINYQYKYNSKELQTETGMYDYGARFYMPDLGRWGVVDPLAEKFPAWSPYHYAFDNPVKFIDPTGMEAEVANKPTDWYWNQKTQRVEWRNSSKSFINEGNGNLLSNVGKTTQEVMRNYGIASKISIKDQAISGSISWELHNDKTPTKGGVPVPMGSYDGIVSVNLSNNLTIAKDTNGISYIDEVNTTINATYHYNSQAINIDKNTVFFSEISKINKYTGEGKMTWQTGLDDSPSINRFYGDNFHPLNYKPINVKSEFNQYISNGLNFKLTLRGTNARDAAFKYTTIINNQNKK